MTFLLGAPCINLLTYLFTHLSIEDAVANRCHTCDFIARFCRATLLHDKIAYTTEHVATATNRVTTKTGFCTDFDDDSLENSLVFLSVLLSSIVKRST